MPLFRIVSGSSIVLPPLPRVGGRFVPAKWTELGLLVHRQSPLCQIQPPKDAHFARVPAADLPALVAWSMRLQAELGGFRPEVRDCDDFADAFDLAASWAAAAAKLEAAPLVGVLSVRCAFAWAGIPGDNGGHAVNLVLCDDGAHVVEPQNGQTCPLEIYPNRAHLFALDGL